MVIGGLSLGGELRSQYPQAQAQTPHTYHSALVCLYSVKGLAQEPAASGDGYIGIELWLDLDLDLDLVSDGAGAEARHGTLVCQVNV